MDVEGKYGIVSPEPAFDKRDLAVQQSKTTKVFLHFGAGYGQFREAVQSVAGVGGEKVRIRRRQTGNRSAR